MALLQSFDQMLTRLEAVLLSLHDGYEYARPSQGFVLATLTLGAGLCAGLGTPVTFLAIAAIIVRLFPFVPMPPAAVSLAGPAVMLALLAGALAEFVLDKAPGADAWWNRRLALLKPALAAATLALVAGKTADKAQLSLALLVAGVFAWAFHLVKTTPRVVSLQAGTGTIINPIASCVEFCFVCGLLFPLVSMPSLVWLFAGMIVMVSATIGAVIGTEMAQEWRRMFGRPRRPVAAPTLLPEK